MGLLLEAVEADGPWRWRWLLRDEETGNPVADHPVRLNPASAEVTRFADLYGFVDFYAAPGRVVRDGTRFVAAAGQWAGRELLGESVGAAIAAAAPVTVRVKVPAVLDPVLLWPLELAHAGGKPLAARGDVTLVYDVGPDAPARRNGEAAPVLRVLAVFSQPAETDMLALRRERYALSRLIRRIAGRERAAVELRVVQYGVTRERLRQIADDGDGWDVLHLSGHGAGGVFLLEKADGSPDLVTTADLVTLLRPVRRRVRLAVVSACDSAADATAETYRLLGLTEQAEALETASAADLGAAMGGRADGADAATPGGVADGTGTAGAGGKAAATTGRRPVTAVPGLARALVRELGCPVVGMRYPVSDEFAISFGDMLYEQLLSRRQPIDVAVARAVAEAAGPTATAARPAVSLATPGVFGAQAAGLRLPVPRGRPRIDPSDQRMAYFPDEPSRFVGRASAMARASAVLAPNSGKTGVLLHGMVGAGKTACALELAYRHQDAFAALAFWQAPTKDEEWPSALPDLANRLDIQLGDYGFTMASHIGTTAQLEKFLPQLRAVMADAGVLLVLDNLETLLTPDGGWRDPRWDQLITALVSHDGESRVILTSRIAPASLGQGNGGPTAASSGGSLSWRGTSGGATPAPVTGQVLTLPVHALSLGESVTLARELPNLRALLHTDSWPVREANPDTHDDAAVDAHAKAATDADAESGDDEREEARAEADRARVRRVLRMVQGHPKLMELADAAAADPAQLDVQLAAAEAAAEAAEGPGGVEASADEQTGGVTGTGSGLDAFFRAGTSTLEPEQFLDALSSWTVGALGALPAEARLMAEFVACLEDSDRVSSVIDANWADLWRRLNRPDDAPAPVPLLNVLADAALIESEPIMGQDAADHTGEPAVSGDQSAMGSGPDSVAYRVHPGVAGAIAEAAGPGMREAADAELAVFWYTVFDWARTREGEEDSDLVVRAGLAAAPYLLRRGDWDTAGMLLEQASMRDRSPGTVQAALPSLRRIVDATGAPEDVIVLARILMRVDSGEAERLLRDAANAAANAGDFGVASAGAAQLFNLLRDAGRLAEALAVAEQKPDYTRRARLGPWSQLLDQGQRLQVLGRMGEHARVLAETDNLRAAMANLPERPDANETANPWNVREGILSNGFGSALATSDWARCLELSAEIIASKRRRGAGEHEIARFRFNDAGPLIRLGRLGEAGRLLAECQRIFEDHADTVSLATVLSNRADLEYELGRVPTATDLERAALRLSYARPEPQDIAVSHHNLAIYLGRLGDDPDLPSTVAEVVTVAELTEGVCLGGLLAALQPDPGIVEGVLAEILGTAAELSLEDGQPDIARYLQTWEPVIAAIADTGQPGQEAPPDLIRLLDERAETRDWAALTAVLRRILAGERGESLLDGLDPIDTAIAEATLARLA
jgi:tetratricopeptide (TPR) repeat protein